ncbi:MAG: Mor transcription activator family protein, partial [Romboutsia sp.]
MLKYLTKEDLPESLGDIVDVIGLDNVKDLIKLAGGSSIYIPSENSVIKPVRNKIMKENFNGS